jgi:6-phosphogluconolactonase
MNVIEYADQEMLSMNVANVLAGALKKVLLTHDTASFAVPGGTTPGPVFDMLSGIALDWDKVTIMLTDERWVGEGDPQSNTRLIRERLLVDRAAEARFLPFWREGLTPEEAADEVAPVLEGELPISLLLLGMGADMHCASLFPGAEGLDRALASDAPLLCPVRPEGELPRVTLPAHVLEGAMDKHLVIFGDAKREALERAQGLSPQEAPIAAVLDDLTVHWAD